MTSHHPSDPEASATDSVSSTPRSEHPPPPPARWHHDDPGARVRLMCSFGGRILPRPGDHQLRYVGGDTRIVAVPRPATFVSLLAKLSKLSGLPSDATALKYQLPSEDLDALISLTSDEDLDIMMEEYDRIAATSSSTKTPRLRLFLFPSLSPSSGFGSILDGPALASASSKRDSWFLDALNARRGVGLERGRSEASSIVSEVPDYLFGLDNNSDAEHKPKTLDVSASDTGSPAPQVSSPQFCSASSAPSVPPIPDLPPVKTKVEAGTGEGRDVDIDVQAEAHAHAQPGYVANPVWQYVHEPVQVYYVPGPVPGGSLPVRHVTMPVQYVHQAPPAPIGYAQPMHGLLSKPVYSSGGAQLSRPAVVGGTYEYPTAAMAEGYELPAGSGLVRNPAMAPAYAMAGVQPQPAPAAGGGPEMRIGKAS